MKHGLLLITAVFLFLGSMAVPAGAVDKAGDPPPTVEFPKLNYEFDTVVDGTQVTHDFVVKNTGNGVLAISNVKTG